MIKNAVLLAIAVVFLCFFYCEVIIYYVAVWHCSWPDQQLHSDVARALILADPHLLGERRGHWFDKLRRERQMYRSFRAAMTFNPDAIFIAGDVFDEGQWCYGAECSRYRARFVSLFGSDVPTYVAAGNHDVGFHYAIEERRLKWFHESFGSEIIQLIVVKQIPFVLVNSMTMEGDGCRLCISAERKLKVLNSSFSCLKEERYNCGLRGEMPKYTRPVLIQHFPLFRKSDEDCQEPDDAPHSEKVSPMREKWECISKESSVLLLELLNPRVVFAGHTHFGCRTVHSVHNESVLEHTVSSFSWRNTNQPVFILASFSAEDFAVEKCLLPQESTVISIYCTGAFVVFLIALFTAYHSCRRVRGKLKV